MQQSFGSISGIGALKSFRNILCCKLGIFFKLPSVLVQDRHLVKCSTSYLAPTSPPRSNLEQQLPSWKLWNGCETVVKQAVWGGLGEVLVRSSGGLWDADWHTARLTPPLQCRALGILIHMSKIGYGIGSWCRAGVHRLSLTLRGPRGWSLWLFGASRWWGGEARSLRVGSHSLRGTRLKAVDRWIPGAAQPDRKSRLTLV